MKSIQIEESVLEKVIVIGDRVLIKLRSHGDKTRSGLYLPPGVRERERVQSGYVMKTGPGYPIPLPADDKDEPWMGAQEQIHYIPLQVVEGDLAIFLLKDAVELIYREEKYFIVPQQAILMVERDEELFN